MIGFVRIEKQRETALECQLDAIVLANIIYKTPVKENKDM